MKPTTLEGLAEDPVGRYVFGDTFIHGCPAPELWFLLLWGRPQESHAVAIGRSLALTMAPPAQPHATLIDASRLEGLDPGAFSAAQRYVSTRAAALSGWITRLALVHPSGINGAIVAGAFKILPRPYPVEAFPDVDAALAWIAQGAASRAPITAAALDAVYRDVTGTSTLVSQVRALFADDLEQTTVPKAAKRLGLSARTLQRKLLESGTTFQAVLTEARIEAARRMLIETDAPITKIALDVGCASPQHFSSMFRRHVGKSPGAFRRQHRGRA